MEEIKKQITESLFKAAKSYYKRALELYLKDIEVGNFDHAQVIIGNFSISVELFSKSLIALRCFPLIYAKESSNKIFQALHYKETLDEMEYNSILKELKQSKLDTIDFNNAFKKVRSLYEKDLEIFPKKIVNQLRDVRNNSVHSVIYETEESPLFKVAYLTTCLHRILNRETQTSDNSETFNKIEEIFNDKEKSTALEKIEKAKSKVKEKDIKGVSPFSPEFEDIQTIHINCPICKSKANIEGEPEGEWDGDPENGYYVVNLMLNPFYFSCHFCDLSLEGTKQLENIPIEKVYEIDQEVFAWEFQQLQQQAYAEEMYDRADFDI